MDRNKKEPCGDMALIVTKNDFYYTVIRCIGVILGVQSSSIKPEKWQPVPGATGKPVSTFLDTHSMTEKSALHAKFSNGLMTPNSRPVRN